MGNKEQTKKSQNAFQAKHNQILNNGNKEKDYKSNLRDTLQKNESSADFLWKLMPARRQWNCISKMLKVGKKSVGLALDVNRSSSGREKDTKLEFGPYFCTPFLEIDRRIDESVRI